MFRFNCIVMCGTSTSQYLLIFFIQFLIFWHGVSSAPQIPNEEISNPESESCVILCSSNGSSEPPFLKYVEKEPQKYKIEGSTFIHSPSSLKGEGTQLNYIANIDITSETKCSFVLSVLSLEISGVAGNKKTVPTLNQYPAKFAWHNGKLDKLCLDPRESESDANFKRSIISNLQVSSWSNVFTRTVPTDGPLFYETDINGRCPVTIESNQEQDGSWLVRKNKNLNKCQYRQGYDFAFKTSFLNLNDENSVNPFVDASLNSVIRIRKGMIESVQVEEEYTYQPLSHYADSMTRVTTNTKITHVGHSKTSPALSPPNLIPKSLLFDNVKSQKNKATVPIIVKAVQDASLEIDGTVPKTAASDYNKLINVLQHASKENLLIAHEQLKSGAGVQNSAKALNVFWDALISAATPDTVEAAATLLENKEMPKNKTSDFLASLSFVKYPTVDTLSAISALLDGPDVTTDRYLAVGSLIRSFVMNNPNQNSQEVNKLMEKLSQPILTTPICKTVHEEDKVISVMKGIRNARFMTPEVSKVIQSYSLNPNISNRVRVAALQTMASYSNDAENIQAALGLLKDMDQDSEIRIQAFLVYVNSPSSQITQTIKEILDNERSDQVGTYITSYIRNLRSSTNPEKEVLKHYLGNISTKNKFSFDFRQHSQNYEISQYFSGLNLGYVGEADVLFSQRSYVPRSTSLNLDVSIFGNNVNVFGLDARFENLDILLEKLAGPKSYINNNNAETIADDLSIQASKYFSELGKKASIITRSKRDLKKLQKNLNAPNAASPVSDKYLDLDFSLSMFKSEILWSSYHIDKDHINTGQYLDALLLKIREAIDNANDIDIDYKKHRSSPLISNSVIYYPSSTGFPIKITTNAVSIVNFKMTANVDAANMIKSPGNSKLNFYVSPSANLQLDAVLEVDTPVLSVGLKASSSLHTATGMAIEVDTLEGNGFDLKFKLPVKEQDIFTFETKAFNTIQEMGQPVTEAPIKPTGQRYEYSKSFDQLVRLAGVSFQTEFSSPNFKYIPVFSPNKLSIRMKNEDPNLKYYQARFAYDYKSADYGSVELKLDTPGSTINRQVSIFAEGNSTQNRYYVELVNFKKRMSVEALGTHNESELLYSVKFKNDENEYYMKAGAMIQRAPYRTVYKPFVDFKVPTTVRDVSLDKVRLSPKQMPQLLFVNGAIVLSTKENSPRYKKYDFEQLSIVSPLGKIMLEGYGQIDLDVPEVLVDLKSIYGDDKSIAFQTGYRSVVNNTGENETAASFAIIPSQWPLYSFKTTFSNIRKPNEIIRNLTFSHGPDTKNGLMKFSLDEKYFWEFTPNSMKLVKSAANIDASYPLWKLSGGIALRQESPAMYRGRAKLTMDKTKLQLNGSVALGVDKPGRVDVEFQSKLNNRSLTVNAIRDIVGEDKSLVTVNLNTVPGKQISAEIDLTHTLKERNTVIKVTPVVKILDDNTEYKYDFGLVNTPQEKNIYLAAYPKKKRTIEIRAGYVSNMPKMDAKAMLFLKDNVDGMLDLNKDASSIKGELNLNMLKMKRQINGVVNMEKSADDDYTGFIEVFWDASKDRSQKIRIDTETKFIMEPLNISSDNTIRVANYTLKSKANLMVKDSGMQKLVVADINFMLPNSSSFGGKVVRSTKYNNSLEDYDLALDGFYTAPGSQVPLTINYTLHSDNVDLSKIIFNVNSSFSLVNTDGQGLDFKVSSQRNLVKQLWSTSAEILLTGSIVKNPIELRAGVAYPESKEEYGQVNSERSLAATSGFLQGKLGKEYAISTRGRLVDNTLDAKLKLKVPADEGPFTFEWNTTTSVDIIPSKSMNLSAVNSVIWNSVKFANCTCQIENLPQNGKFLLDWISTDIPKRSLEVVYSYNVESSQGLQGPFGAANFTLKSGRKAAHCNIMTEFSKDLATKVVTLSGSSPVSGNFNIRATNKMEDHGRIWYQDLALNNNNKKWYMLTQVDIQPTKPKLDLVFNSPEGESKLTIELEEPKVNQWKGMADINWQHGGEGYIRGDFDMKLDSPEDVQIATNVDSPVMGINNFSLVARNEAGENGAKKLSFKMKSKGARYSGSIPYTYSKDKYKLSLKGSGVLTVDNDSIPILFKIVRSQLIEAKNGEVGTVNIIYVNMDNKKYVLDIEGKFTDKVFLLKRDLHYGEQIYKMAVMYNVKMTDISDYTKNFLVHIDLKPHVPSGETLIVSGKTTKSYSNYDEGLVIEWAPNKKLEYNMYSTNGKSGFSLNLPQRQITGEAVYSYKLDSSNGDVSLTATVWFDKTKDENQKAMIIMGTEYRIPENEHSIVIRSSVGLQIPTLKKTLLCSTGVLLSPFDEKSIDVRGRIDLFNKKDQAIDITYQVFREKKDQGFSFSDKLEVASRGQQMNIKFMRSYLVCFDHVESGFEFSYLDNKGNVRTSTAKFDLRLSSLSTYIKILDKITFNGTSQVGMGRNYVKLYNDFNLMDHEYSNIITFNTQPSLAVVFVWKGQVKQEAEIHVDLMWEEFVNVRANLVGRGPIANFTLYLDDERFLTSNTELFIDNADILLDNATKDIYALIDKNKVAVRSVSDDLSQQLTYQKQMFRNASMNMKPVIQSANDYLQSLKIELQNDMEGSRNVQKVVNSITNYVFNAIQQMTNFFGEWLDGYNEFLDNVGDYMDAILLQLKKKLLGSSDGAAISLRDIIARTNQLIKQIIAYVKANKSKWKETLSSLNESVRDSVTIVYDVVDQVTADTKDFIEKVVDYVRSLPLTSYLKDRVGQLKDYDTFKYLWSSIIEITASLKDSLPTEELKTLYDMILAAIDKIINNKPYDIKLEARNIAKQTVESIRSLYNVAYDSNYMRDLSDNLPQLSLSSVRTIPDVWGSTVSSINKLRNLDFSNVGEVLETYSLTSVNPLNLIPPFKKVGVIANGNQVVTMNGNYFTISNDCQYLLVGEFETYSFTVAAEINKGAAVRLAVSTSSEMIEVFPDSAPRVNGDTFQDFPIYEKTIYAIRTPSTIEIFIDNSIQITCTPQLDLIIVQVSGFYYNKIQGLLGTVNADSYTDFMTPEKKVAQDVNAFMKSYQISECANSNPSVTPSSKSSSPACEDVFDRNSVLRRGFSYIKTKPFRDMCEQMVAMQASEEEKMNAACNVAQAFSLVSYKYGYYLKMPDYCSKCLINKSALPIGETVSISTPNKSADIMLILEKTKANQAIYKELLINSIKAIRSALKKKGINDCNFLLIAYGPADLKPSIHTSNGKLTMSNKTKVSFSDGKKAEPSTELGKLVRNVKFMLGMDDANMALKLANEYSFRPDAVKAIIQLKSTEGNASAIDQYDVYNTLINTITSWNIVNNRIPLFVVSPMESSDVNSGNSQLFGVDLNYMYTADGPKSFENGVFDTLQHLKQYKASVILPISTGGAVFDSSVFNKSNPNIRSQLSGVFANTVFSSLVAYERYSNCFCTYQMGVFSEVRCQATTAPAAA